MKPDSLTASAIRGVGFLTGQTFLSKIFFLIRSIFLARILSPHDFGIISLSIVLIQGLGSITSIGMDKIIIQKSFLDENIVGNAWTLNVIRGMLLTFITYILCISNNIFI
jgi:O-antigen/teichoic acid export membrane protein